MPFAPGESVGPYRILEQLGQGGMATVYKAYHAALDRYVALKVLHPAFVQDTNFTTRFEREARIVAKLDHPNIIPIHDFSRHEGIPYLVIRYVEGKTLKEILRDGLLRHARILEIICPVADALAYAHTRGVLHRDIKPSNIILAQDGHVYLADFGLARMAAARDSTLSKDTVIGTPQYLSPEQGKSVTLDSRSDLYSLGIVLYELLVGRVPFDGDTPFAVIHDHIFAPLPLPRKVNPNLTPEIERFLLKALAKNRNQRFSTATAMAAALTQVLGEPKAPAPSGTPVPVHIPPAPSATTPTRRDELRAIVKPPSKSHHSPPPAPPPAPDPFAWLRPRATPPYQAIDWPTRKPERRRRWTSWWPIILAVLAINLVLLSGILAWHEQTNILRAFKRIVDSDPISLARDQVADNPQDPLAHANLADALAARKNFDAAFEEFDRAIELNAKLPDLYLRAGALAENLDDLDRAFKYYQRGWQAINDNLDFLLAQGRVLGKSEKWEMARTTYDKVLRADPSSALAMAGLGDYFRAQNRPAEALREYTRGLVVNPNLPEIHFGLGMLAMERGANEEAKRQFQMVVNSAKSDTRLKEQAAKQLRALAK